MMNKEELLKAMRFKKSIRYTKRGGINERWGKCKFE